MPKIFTGGAAHLPPPPGAALPGPPLNASSKLSAQRYTLKVQAFDLNSTYIPAEIKFPTQPVNILKNVPQTQIGFSPIQFSSGSVRSGETQGFGLLRRSLCHMGVGFNFHRIC